MDKQLFLDLYQAFDDNKQEFINAGVPPIAFIDRFRGQPLNPEQFEYYALPAIFIERNITWAREGQVYNGTLNLGFHLVIEPTWDQSNIATNKDAGMKYFTLLDKVREVLDNFRAGYVSALFRTQDDTIDAGVILYERLGYQCIYYGDTKIEPAYNDEPYSEQRTLNTTGRRLLKKI
jgi:hypothetical protein